VHYQTSLLYHCRAVQACLPHFRAQATLSFRNFSLEVRARNRYYHLMPQFVSREQGRLRYFPQLQDNTIGFIGWLPYFNKRWPTGREKFAFKEFCAANSLRTPAYSTQSADALGSALIKHRFSSFGNGMRGPFRKADQARPQCRLAENEYYEEFVPGRIAKAWYWDEKPVCLEIFDMPTVTGDGVRSFQRLVADQVAFPGEPPERSQLEAFARYQGIASDEAVPAGTTVLGDFRYGSPLFQVRVSHNSNVLAQHEKTAAGRQLMEAGPAFWRSIPEDARHATLYTVDAIIDAEERVWFLEMNCNPMVHPDAYFAVFEGLFGPAEKVVPAQGVAPPPSSLFPGLSPMPLSPAPQLAPTAAFVAARTKA
jgi:hypothetical protein